MSKLTPLVSIIIPVFNRENTIRETIQSIKHQSYKTWECILVDDGSTDATLKIIQEISKSDLRIKLFIRPDILKKGANACRNYGFELCKGTYVNWFDSDDLMHVDFIKKKMELFAIKTHANLVISKTKFFKNNISNITGEETRTSDSKNLLEDFVTLKRSWYVCDPMWKKSFLKGKELFSTDLLKGQDRDFHIRMLTEGSLKIAFCDFYLTFYRQHQNSISNDYSLDVSLSIHNVLVQRLKLLRGYESETINLFILVQLFKNYQYVYHEKNVLKEIINCSLSQFNTTVVYVKWNVKFVIAVICLNLFGKGSKFLSGE